MTLGQTGVRPPSAKPLLALLELLGKADADSAQPLQSLLRRRHPSLGDPLGTLGTRWRLSCSQEGRSDFKIFQSQVLYGSHFPAFQECPGAHLSHAQSSLSCGLSVMSQCEDDEWIHQEKTLPGDGLSVLPPRGKYLQEDKSYSKGSLANLKTALRVGRWKSVLGASGRTVGCPCVAGPPLGAGGGHCLPGTVAKASYERPVGQGIARAASPKETRGDRVQDAIVRQTPSKHCKIGDSYGLNMTPEATSWKLTPQIHVLVVH